MPPRVGVVVRTKERPLFLTRALRDIGAQTFADWRVVVVNDGGDPEMVENAVVHSAIADRVDVVHLAAGAGGRCAAANAGISASVAEFVVLHDDDDLWHPAFLAETVAYLDAHPEAGGVSAATEIVYETLRGGVWTETSRAPFWQGMTRISMGEMLRINHIVPISFLYRRSLHDELGGYDETLDAVEDWDFYLRVLPTHPIGFLPAHPLAYWTQRPHAGGAAANSMFELSAEHVRDDAIVRDRALARWIAENGPALPLYIASVEERILDETQRILNETERMLDEQRRRIVVEICDRHPIWRRLRRLRGKW